MQMGEAACAAAEAVGYYNAGTVEFIFDCDTDKFYFMEMNTRLQVEHPVTEEITGLDLVEWQFKVAAGHKLPITCQSMVPLLGHAIECRITVEDPKNDFLPQTGKITTLREPSSEYVDVRLDSGVREGDEITAYYDPMIAKLIAHADTREQAIQKMQRALSEYTVIGVPTNIKFHKRILANEQFMAGNYDTNFLVDQHDNLFGQEREISLPKYGTISVIKAYLQNLRYRVNRQTPIDPWEMRDMFRVNHLAKRRLMLIDDKGLEHTTFIEYVSEDTFNVF
jgi:3-methylcrotonyl-CoA carboxylase alpha subunit